MHRLYHPIVSAGVMLACLMLPGLALADDTPNNKPQPKRTFKSMAEALKPTERVTYKKVGGRELKLHLFRPKPVSVDENGKDIDRSRPAYVLIHGGGWRSNNAQHFYPYAASLVPKGYVGVSVEYRLASRDQTAKDATTVFDCVKDARAAVRYIRKHAKQLGIDPDRIAVGGGSAGAHLAFGCAAFDGIDHADEDTQVSCVPNAIILLFGVLDTSPDGYGNTFIGKDWKKISPLHQIRKGLPPMILFHGDRDRVAKMPILTAFCKALDKNEVPYKLVLENGGVHGHLNKDMKLFDDAAGQTYQFLVKVAFNDPEKSKQ